MSLVVMLVGFAWALYKSNPFLMLPEWGLSCPMLSVRDYLDIVAWGEEVEPFVELLVPLAKRILRES